MGSPLLPVITNLFMDKPEKKAISTAQLKFSFLIRYTNCFTIWPHGKDTLTEFLSHINSIHSKYNSHQRQRQTTAFHSQIFSKRRKTQLLHTQKTHIHKQILTRTVPLPNCVATICSEYRALHLLNMKDKKEEIDILKETLFLNGYTSLDINRPINKKDNTEPKKKHVSTLKLPYTVWPRLECAGQVLSLIHIQMCIRDRFHS